MSLTSGTHEREVCHVCIDFFMSIVYAGDETPGGS